MSSENSDKVFSVRLEENQKDILAALAKQDNTTTAALARRYILEGIERELDPVKIERKMDLEKQRLLTIAAQFRERLT